MQKKEESLRLAARDAMRRDAVPRRRPEHTWGGPGNGAQCPICQDMLATGEMAFDLEFENDAENPTCNLQMHLRCFAAWELERDSVANARREPADDVFEPHSLPSGTKAPTLTASERKHPDSGSRG